MKLNKNQVVAGLLINIAMLLFCLFNLLKYIGVSTVRTSILAASSLVFLSFCVLIILKNRKTLTGQPR